ncbi:hypothetical protein AVEN_105349-1 [Araneus ventricosus]|uniref:Uncharacterized protein n=1 Tax=Araneus ventricosus TaxID=182803 RepID=A0A4Y2W6P8_ARAVE|nr:hypothetical protein AVEN_105349-1 [Araneus ventricosus]
MDSGKLLQFENLKQYRDETNATIDTNYFSIALKNMKGRFAERFEQFKTNKSTLAFIVNPLNTNTNEMNIEPFGLVGWFGIYWRKSQIWPCCAKRTVKAQHIVLSHLELMLDYFKYNCWI